MRTMLVIRPAMIAGMFLSFLSPTRAAKSVSAANLAAVTINDSSANPSYSLASPYPSAISVSAPKGKIAAMAVTLSGISHVFPRDIAALLVSPHGQSVVLLSNTGGIFGVSGVTLVFQDGAPDVPDNVALVSGTYAATGSNAFPAPAPSGSPAAELSAFNNLSASGAWNLFVFDDDPNSYFGVAGEISNGWSLAFVIDEPAKVRIKGGKRTVSRRAVFQVRGTAVDDLTRTTAVFVKVNKGPFRRARGKTIWRSFEKLKTGRNVIKAYAVDTVGNRSHNARQTVKFIRR